MEPRKKNTKINKANFKSIHKETRRRKEVNDPLIYFIKLHKLLMKFVNGNSLTTWIFVLVYGLHREHTQDGQIEDND